MAFDTDALPFETPKYLRRDWQGWTEVNDAGVKHGEPVYLNYCPHCGWAGSIALWRDSPPGLKDTGPHCPRCKGGGIGRLLPE